MKPCVSRGSRRTASPRAIPIRELAILAASLVVFIGGIILFAGALGAHAASRGAPPAPPSISAQSNTKDSLYGDLITRDADEGQVPLAEPSQDTQNAQDAEAPATSTPPPPPSQGTPEPELEPAPETSYEEAVEEPAPQPSTSEQQCYVIHHTAYREEPVYRTVHHQASTPREVTVGGRTHVEWTSCPVCGNKHESAYNERIVDHVNESYCSACGAKHANAYDETVY